MSGYSKVKRRGFQREAEVSKNKKKVKRDSEKNPHERNCLLLNFIYLMSDIWSSLTNIPSHPSKSTLMIITIQQLILSLSAMITRLAALINFQTRLLKHHIKSLFILLLFCCPRHGGRNRHERGIDSGGCPRRGCRWPNYRRRDFKICR